MKKTKLIICLASLFLISCSTSQDIVRNDSTQVESSRSTVTSYGPKGLIIKGKMVDSTSPTQQRESEYTYAASTVPVTNAKRSMELVNKSIGKGVKRFGKNTARSYNVLAAELEKRSVIYSTFNRSSVDFNADGNPSRNWSSFTGFGISLVGLFVAGILLGIGAMVFGAIGLKSQRRGFAIAAIIIGIIDIVGAIIVLSMM